MLAVPDAAAASDWYKTAIGAGGLWTWAVWWGSRSRAQPWGIHRQGGFVDPCRRHGAAGC
jgi:hypothetical protein